DLEAKVKTLEDENEGLLKIAKGDTTVAADLAQKLDHTQKRLEEVIGTRESGERAKKEFAEAEKKLLDAHDVLLKYMPRGEDEEEWLKHGDEFGMSASLSQQFADRFMKISRTYIKFREAYEG
ncbi:hypothetical protein KKF61_08090, partial [Patescibacteria group bacterium]|nr:hypothetical protein [Patescibacteria group bacterium]